MSQNFIDLPLSYKCASMPTKGVWPSRKTAPRPQFLVEDLCGEQSKIAMLLWESPDTSSMIVRIQLKERFVIKDYTPSVSNIPT